MKKLVFIFLLLVSFKAESQQVVPLEFNSSCWRYTGWFMDGNFPYIEDVYSFVFEGDTTINSNLLHKYYYSLYRHWGFNTGIPITIKSYEGSLRTDNQRIYYVPKDSTNEILLYDYKLSIGDTIPFGLLISQTPLIIIDTATILMEDGSQRKQWILNNYYPHTITYGIGTDLGLLPPSSFIDTTYDGGTEFITYCENGNRVYHANNVGGFLHADSCIIVLGINKIQDLSSIFVYPNPCSVGLIHIKQVSKAKKPKSLQLNNLFGQSVDCTILTYDDETLIDVSNVKNGYYILSLTLVDGTTKYDKVLIDY